MPTNPGVAEKRGALVAELMNTPIIYPTSTTWDEEALEKLRKAYASGNLMLYIGAGVSVQSGLPTWQKLVLTMYFSALNRQSLNPWRLYPSYLFATAEWHLERAHEPLEITARKLWRYYEDNNDFLLHLWETLYAGFLDAYSKRKRSYDTSSICTCNQTLETISRLCKQSTYGIKGVKGVITYNYDSLLEIALGEYPFQAIYKSEPAIKGKMPVYHVHGYIPLNVAELTDHEIVFTEDQYHQSAKDPYSWTNLIQIHSLSSCTGLMIGLSLSDRNMRRLLDAVSQMPVETENYALLKEPTWEKPNEAELNQINEKARSYAQHLASIGFTMSDADIGQNELAWREQIIAIIDEVRRVDVEQQTFILKQLGVHPIWYKEHAEIPPILEAISN